MDRANGKEAIAFAKARLLQQARPKPVQSPQRRDVVEVQTKYTGAGRDRSQEPEKRALTRIERMHMDGKDS